MKITGSRAVAFAAAAAVLVCMAPASLRPASAESGEITALVASNAKGAFTQLIK